MNKNQYNQGIGKYKVLSSTAGVGSIVPTTWGGFIMPLSINNWSMIRSFTDNITKHPDDSLERLADDSKCTLITDHRFVKYLGSIQQLPNLKALISVPHLNLNDFNSCDYQSHPIFKKWSNTPSGKRLANEPDTPEGNIEYVRRFLGENGDTLTIPAIVFPRWFRSTYGDHRLMPIERWKDKWEQDYNDFTKQQAILKHDTKKLSFVQPAECKTKNKEGGNPIIVDKRITPKKGGKVYYVPETIPLEQVQMVLICPNGHIADIPWDKYFAFKNDPRNQNRRLSGDDYAELFDIDPNTCTNNKPHQLQWLPSRSNPESYGTLKCPCCNAKVSLEGIMNIRPRCHGDKPWAGDPDNNQNGITREDCDLRMRWALVTSNSVYYAESFKSLFIPEDLLDNHLNDGLSAIYEKLIDKNENWKNSNQNDCDFYEDYLFSTIVSEEVDCYNDENDEEDRINYDQEMLHSIINVFKGLVSEDDLSKQHRKIFKRLKNNFKVESGHEAIKIICVKNIDNIDTNEAESVLRIFDQGPQEDMTPEKYRYEEYKVFMEHNNYCYPEGKYLCFNDVDMMQMKPEISTYFSKIKQFSSLAVSSTQLQFSRATSDNSDEEQQNGDTIKQMIFDCNRDEVRALPANQNFGEGLFFSFNEGKVREFCKNVDNRYDNISAGDLGHQLLAQMNQYGKAKFYLLHTFSHIIMKELEFTCGYPTASLQERIYYSDRMNGVLIYTADGSEGSMGGLVAQGSPKTLEKIILKALQRAIDCSSDPLCWENSDQLNKAACFSCAMVSETSCEFGNMGLDRRALVDDTFGFFRSLV